jgi:FAD/FMN-containing dehydrogenase
MADLQKLRNELANIVGSKYVTDEKFVALSYTRGPFMALFGGARGRAPALVVRPGSIDEIVEIVRLCNRERVPIIPRGGGGSVTVFPPLHVGVPEKNVLLDMTRLNKIIEIDEEYMTVTAECGILLSKLAAEVQKRGFHVHTVDVPYHMDTLGGVLSGFVGGGEPADLATAGVMNRYVLGLKVVLPTGEVIQTGSGPGTNIYQSKVLHREAGSPDVTGIFIGDGGIFGIKVEATLSIRPFPRVYKVGAYSFNDTENMWKAFCRLVSTEPFPYTRLLAFREYDSPEWLFTYVIRGHFDEEVNFKLKILKKICDSYGQETFSSKALEIASLFSARDFGKVVASKGSMTYFGEALVPRSSSLEYLNFLNKLIDEELKDLEIVKRVDFIVPYLRTMTITGVLLYFGTRLPPKDVGMRLYKVSEKFSDFLIRKLGGFLEAHQGDVALKTASAWSPSYLSFMRRLKSAFDPNNILMPNLWGF